MFSTSDGMTADSGRGAAAACQKKDLWQWVRRATAVPARE